MKTNKELLDFYGVELGKTYKITKQNKYFGCLWTGNTFVVTKDEFDMLNIVITAKHDIDYARNIHTLVDFDYEEVKELLTDEEKEYLRAVIKPFRDRIQRIYKTEAGNFYEGGEVLFFELKLNDYFYLPELPLGKMFSGMEQDKKYTLEELGI